MVAVLAVGVAVGIGWARVVASIPVWFRVALLALPFAVGLVAAYRAGLWLQLWRRGAHDDKWALDPVRHRAGVSAGWSFLYGLLYAGMAWLSIVALDAVSLQEVAGTPEQKAAAEAVNAWYWALVGLIVGSVVLAVLLMLVAPILIPARARRALTRSLVDDPVLRSAVCAQNQPSRQARLIVATLERRGATYRYLVAPRPDKPAELGAAPASMDIVDSIVRGTSRPWCPVPVSVHILAAAVAIGTAVALRLGALPAVGAWTTASRGTIWLPLAGATWLVLLATLEGRRLGPAPRRAAVPAFWLATMSTVGLVTFAVGAATWQLWPVDAQACALLLTALLALATGAQVICVLYTRRWFCRQASTEQSRSTT